MREGKNPVIIERDSNTFHLVRQANSNCHSPRDPSMIVSGDAQALNAKLQQKMSAFRAPRARPRLPDDEEDKGSEEQDIPDEDFSPTAPRVPIN